MNGKGVEQFTLYHKNFTGILIWLKKLSLGELTDF